MFEDPLRRVGTPFREKDARMKHPTLPLYGLDLCILQKHDMAPDDVEMYLSGPYSSSVVEVYLPPQLGGWCRGCKILPTEEGQLSLASTYQIMMSTVERMVSN